MATSTGEVEKINVRSPFYLTIGSEDAPPAYTPPATLTQPLGCGQEISIGEDVGTRIYEVDITNRSGTFTINYTIYTPVKITTQVTGDSVVNRGYIGGDDKKQELIELGVASSDLTGLTSGAFAQGGIAINRGSDSAATLTITVDAPLTTDDYKLIMACPAETAAPESTFSLPSSTPTNTNLLDGSQTLSIALYNQTYGSALPVSPSMSVYVNDSLVQTLSPAAFGFEDPTKTPTIIFSSISGLGWASNVQSFDKDPVIISDSTFISGDNKIGISMDWDINTWNSQIQVRLMEFMRTGIFRNTTANAYQFAYPYYQGTFSFYGGTNILDTEVRSIGLDNHLFSRATIYTFNYNTTTRTVSNTSETNSFTISSASHATGGIKV
tara:strand:- start:1017 stop:2162 length:1146 start_codon:yes stop_codon:yes gene_type:complete